MDAARFDALITSLAAVRTRRGTLAALMAAAISGSGAAGARPSRALAASVCRGRNERCSGKRECCSEQCRSKKGKRRKCRCSPEGKRCHAESDCCTSGVRLFCVSGFCVRER